MRLINLSKKATISEDAKEALSFWDRLLGLLRTKNPRTLIFYTRFGIHTFGLLQPIDILILDKDLRIVKLKETLKPNHLFLWNPRCQIIIELPAGSVKNSRTTLGDKIELV